MAAGYHRQPDRSVQSSASAPRRNCARSEQNYRMLFRSIDEGFCIIEVFVWSGTKSRSSIVFCKSAHRLNGRRRSPRMPLADGCAKSRHSNARTLVFDLQGASPDGRADALPTMKPETADAGMMFTPSGSKTPGQTRRRSLSTTLPSAQAVRKLKHETTSAAIAKCRRSWLTHGPRHPDDRATHGLDCP